MYIIRGVLLVCFLTIYGSLAQQIPEEFKELAAMLHTTCVTESGVTEDLIAETNKGHFAEEQSLKCYMKCLMSQMATIDDDGTVDVEAVIAIIPDNFKAKMEPVVRACGSKVGVDPCDTAFLTHKCYYEQDPSLFFLL